MRKIVSDHIASFDVCQHAKSDNHRPRVLLESVSLPVQKWQTIGMDWIVGLPRITRDRRVFDSVLTVTDRATKMAHFIPTWKEATAVDTADQFIKYIVKYHGLPRSITINTLSYTRPSRVFRGNATIRSIPIACHFCTGKDTRSMSPRGLW